MSTGWCKEENNLKKSPPSCNISQLIGYNINLNAALLEYQQKEKEDQVTIFLLIYSNILHLVTFW